MDVSVGGRTFSLLEDICPRGSSLSCAIYFERVRNKATNMVPARIQLVRQNAQNITDVRGVISSQFAFHKAG